MNPCLLLRRWLNAAIAERVPKANAMSLCTVDQYGRPSSRMMLVGAITETGITFFTDGRSPKVQDIVKNPYASALFYWPTLARQIRIVGVVTLLDDSYADRDFASKPYEYRLAITLCQQSCSLISYRQLKQKYFKALADGNNDLVIRRPAYWQGLELRPDSIEFFKGENHRINRRLLLTRNNGTKWRNYTLQP